MPAEHADGAEGRKASGDAFDIRVPFAEAQ